jgi:hypothetical protein
MLLALSVASGSFLHRHAVLGGPKDRHRRALSRMEESEDTRPLMEPARNVISTNRWSHTVCTVSKCRALWLAGACSAAQRGTLLSSPLDHEPEEPGAQHTHTAADPLLHGVSCRHRAAVLLR